MVPARVAGVLPLAHRRSRLLAQDKPMRLSSSVKTALAIVAVTVAYFTVRSGLRLLSTPEDAPAKKAELFVVAIESRPETRAGALSIRGRTEADQKAIVRADASGVVTAAPVAQGAAVREGDVLCRIDVEARAAARREAEAALGKAEIDYQAAVKLAAEGFRSEAGLAGLKAARDQARANADRALIELEKTQIRAPFDGVFDVRSAEVGDLLKPGDPCGTVVKPSPFLIKGAVAEKDVALVRAGDRARASIATGEIVDGAVRFVAAAADPATRTFDIEIEIPNPDGKLRDGVTADVTVLSAARPAHKIPRSALTLGDDGRIGVKLIDAANRARFHAVSIIGEEREGVWVAGLEGPQRVIVRGQDYVKDGETVTAEIAGASS
ncbi:MAG TPA: efflux RND transporter periplasmic adaptor subunit [Parvularcula sp.]|nr:efflux RND transporter periplasmic adaptor subunit [Parvularcula sp.]